VRVDFRFKDEWLLRAVLSLPGVHPETVYEFRKESRPYLAAAVVEAGLARAEAIDDAVKALYRVSTLDVTDTMVQKIALALVPERICRKHHLIPVDLDDDKIIVAMSNPMDYQALADVQAVSGRQPSAHYCTRDRIDQLLGEFYSPEQLVNGLVDRLSENSAVEILEGAKDAADPSDDEAADAVRAPVIKLVNSIISKAVKMKASDIHIEHEERSSAVRFRVDGILRNIMALPRHIASTALVSRIKIMSNLDLTEHRRPQDGRAKLRVFGVEIGLRVSTLPTAFGEKVVIRILDKRAAEVPFEQLGFKPEVAAKLTQLLGAAQGIVLVTGPTGSGKTTTLYSILNKVKSEDSNIVTVEDPIEYKLTGINQVQVNEKSGLNFAAVLRSVLRQDPDIILVGEIRDKETADIAFQTALTGHMVLSTLHTNDTISTVSRLVDMGVERFKIAPGLIAITAQRLARKLCSDCRERVPADQTPPAAAALLAKQSLPPVTYKAMGCAQCEMTGHTGRMSIVEMLVVSDGLKERIMGGADEAALRQHALASGSLHTLAADAAWHISQGHVTFEEVLPYLRSDGEAPQKGDASLPSLPPQPSYTDPSQNRRKFRRILLVDDDESMRSTLREVLEHHGYTVDEAVDGLQALAAISRSAPNMMILDMNMPNLDGLGTIRYLGRGLGNLMLPVIILTTLSDAESEQLVLDYGADDFITKSSSMAVILARINGAFRRMRRDDLPPHSAGKGMLESPS